MVIYESYARPLPYPMIMPYMLEKYKDTYPGQEEVFWLSGVYEHIMENA
jgi:hypothetical protein